MKLEKILNLSAFTLLCTSSIMAMMGENMTAGIGVTIGNTIQEQTFMDNYADSDLGNGPLVGVAMGSNFVISNTGASTSIIDFRNTYYPEAKTNTVGIGLNYKMKGTSAENGFYGAFDYTRYDDMDFMQVALGHETNISGYQSNLNFYIPVGNDQKYNTPNGSTMVGTYGVDWTLSKQIGMVDLGASLGYHWNSDIKDDITAFSFGGEYTFGKNLLTTGAAYQYRDGLDSSDYGYKAYAKIPLHKGLLSTNMGMTGKGDAKMYQPIKRMLGSLIQAKEDTACTGAFESYSYGGVTACASVNPFSNDGAGFPAAAMIKKALGMKSGYGVASKAPKVETGLRTFKTGKTYIVTEMLVLEGGMDAEQGTSVFLTDRASIWANQKKSDGNTVVGSNGATDNHVIFASTRLLANQGGKGMARLARVFQGKEGRSVDANGFANKLDAHDVDSNRTAAIVFFGKGKVFPAETKTAAFMQKETQNKVQERSFGSARAFEGPNASVLDMLTEDGNLAQTAATATTADAAGDGTLTVTGINGLGTIGGATDADTVGHQVTKTMFLDVKVADIGTTSTYDNVTFHNDHGYAYEQIGGQTEMGAVRAKFGKAALGFAKNSLGGNLQIHGGLIDGQDSLFPRTSIVRVTGKNSNTRTAVPTAANAADAATAHGVGITSTYYKGNAYGGNFFDLTDIAGVDNAGVATAISGCALDIRNMTGDSSSLISTLKDKRISAGIHGLDENTSSAVGIVSLAIEAGDAPATGAMGHHLDGLNVISGTNAAGAPALARILTNSLGSKYSKLGNSGFNVVQTAANLDDDLSTAILTAKSTILGNTGTFADGTAVETLSIDALENTTTDGDGILMTNYAFGKTSDFLQTRVSAGEADAFHAEKTFGPIKWQGDDSGLSTIMGRFARLETGSVTDYADGDFTNAAQKNLVDLGIVKALSGNVTPIVNPATVHALAGNTGAWRGANDGTAVTTPVADSTVATNWTNANGVSRNNVRALLKARLLPNATADDKDIASDVEGNSNS